MALLDEKRLMRSVDGDREAAIEMGQAFLLSVSTELATARAAWANGDAKRLAFAIHKMKSSVALFHDGPANMRLSAMEQQARTGSTEVIAEDLAALEETLSSLMREVEAFLSRI